MKRSLGCPAFRVVALALAWSYGLAGCAETPPVVAPKPVVAALPPPDAERLAHSMIEEAKGRASEEGAKIVAQAKADAEQESVKARQALRDQVAALAVKGAEAILRKEVNPAVHADLLARLKTEL